YFKHILGALSSPPFHTEYVYFPDTSQGVPSSPLDQNPKLGRFFHGCLGAIDGSHIHLSARALNQEAFQNQKGFTSQNCLFVCDFDMQFIYTLTGWEGSASDVQVSDAALAKDLKIPNSYYLLADLGFPHQEGILVPYQNKYYHLAE
ncbi:Putative nuclease HARBI1, partial [Leucoagaricus sp. SymC.cos]